MAVAFSCTRARALSRTRHPTHALRKLCKNTRTKQNKGTGGRRRLQYTSRRSALSTGSRLFRNLRDEKNTEKTKRACAHTFLTDRGARCQQISACTTLHEQQPLTHTLGARTDDDICVGPLTRYSRRSLSVVQRSGSPALQPFARTSQFTCI